MSYFTNRVKLYLQDCDLSRSPRDTVAEKIGLKPNRLCERLTSERMTFTILLSEERRARCLALLHRTQRTKAHVLAKACGYRSVVILRRAFPGIMGMSLEEAQQNTWLLPLI